MEIALALIYVLLHIMPAESNHFTLTIRPDTVFVGTKIEDDTWSIDIKSSTSKSHFGNASIKGRQLLLKTKEGELPFDAADALGIPKSPDWKSIKTFGANQVTYHVTRHENRIDFSFELEGSEHPQVITAQFNTAEQGAAANP